MRGIASPLGWFGIVALILRAGTAAAQTAPAASVVAALRQGGLVVVMRHASSPSATPTREQANPDNTTLERQLDQAGRDGARVMGQALRDLKVPIGQVFISPTYRARETEIGRAHV